MTFLANNASRDPFTLVYASLLDELWNAQELRDLVRLENVVRFLGEKMEPRKVGGVSQTDLPEVGIEPATDYLETDFLTGVETIEMAFDVTVASGDKRLDQPGANSFGASLHAVLWAMYRALAGWKQRMIDATTLAGGVRFIESVSGGRCVVSLDDKDLNRGTTGWAARWRYTVRLYFDVLANATTPAEE